MIPFPVPGPRNMTQAIRYEEEVPTPADCNRLRRDTGWPESVEVLATERNPSPPIQTNAHP